MLSCDFFYSLKYDSSVLELFFYITKKSIWPAMTYDNAGQKY